MAAGRARAHEIGQVERKNSWTEGSVRRVAGAACAALGFALPHDCRRGQRTGVLVVHDGGVQALARLERLGCGILRHGHWRVVVAKRNRELKSGLCVVWWRGGGRRGGRASGRAGGRERGDRHVDRAARATLGTSELLEGRSRRGRHTSATLHHMAGNCVTAWRPKAPRVALTDAASVGDRARRRTHLPAALAPNGDRGRVHETWAHNCSKSTRHGSATSLRHSHSCQRARVTKLVPNPAWATHTHTVLSSSWQAAPSRHFFEAKSAAPWFVMATCVNCEVARPTRPSPDALRLARVTAPPHAEGAHTSCQCLGSEYRDCLLLAVVCC